MRGQGGVVARRILLGWWSDGGQVGLPADLLHLPLQSLGSVIVPNVSCPHTQPKALLCAPTHAYPAEHLVWCCRAEGQDPWPRHCPGA